jgi:SAM-dependent methyltransferase
MNANEKKVLNVGGGSKQIALPAIYESWQHVLLDIDPKCNPDLVCDGRLLTSLPPFQFDSVYCSHNLEHYFRHDVPKVLAGFLHVLKSDGFACIRVPDLSALMKIAVERGLDLDDFLYQSKAGPITVQDVIYGYGPEIERSGNDYFAHKTGYSQKLLGKLLQTCGFPVSFTQSAQLEIIAYAFKNTPTDQHIALLKLPPVSKPVAGHSQSS